MLAVISVALLCWAPRAHGASPAASAASQRQGAANQVFVWATTGGGRRLARPHRALVRIRSHGKVIGRARTGIRGIAIVRLKRAPRQFSVQVSGGVFKGQRPKRVGGSLRARVSGYRGGPVYVNPATTLLYYYALLHPKRPLRKDANHVASFLRLPAGHDLEADMISSASFNGRRYLRRARRAGGLDVYSRAQARRVDVKRARASSIESSGALGTLASLSSSLNTYSGLFRAISSVSGALSIVNTTMTLAGVSPLDNEISELSQEMGQLLQEMQVVTNDLDAIRTQVTKLSQQDAEGTYAVLVRQQTTLMGQIDEARTIWVAIANLGAQISCPNGTANCPEAKPVKQVCAAAKAEKDSKTEASCTKLEGMYTGRSGFVEVMQTAGLTDYSKARGLAAAIGDNGLIKYASLATASGQRFYSSAQSALAVAGADYYLTQLSLLISLIGAYQTAPTIATPTANIELGLGGATEAARPLPAQVPSVLPSANVIDISTGMMWQAQLAAKAVLSSSEWVTCPENAQEGGGVLGGIGPALCLRYQYPGLTASRGATPWQMAKVSRFTYLPQEGINPARWVAVEWSGGAEGFVGLPATVGDDAPTSLGYEDWKPAPQKALEGLAAGTSFEAMRQAGFSYKLFVTEERGTPLSGEGENLSVADVLTLPGNGAPAEFNFPNYAGYFNFKAGDVGVGMYYVEDRLRELGANYLMERTPAASECWYYAPPEKPASC